MTVSDESLARAAGVLQSSGEASAAKGVYRDADDGVSDRSAAERSRSNRMSDDGYDIASKEGNNVSGDNSGTMLHANKDDVRSIEGTMNKQDDEVMQHNTLHYTIVQSN